MQDHEITQLIEQRNQFEFSCNESCNKTNEVCKISNKAFEKYMYAKLELIFLLLLLEEESVFRCSKLFGQKITFQT
jgi:hypothetical protein